MTTKKFLKNWLLQKKKVFQIDDIDVNKILEPYSTKNAFKYFLRYNDNDVIRPLCVRLSQMTGYARKFDENAKMFFRVNSNHLLKIKTKYGKKLKN